jgi:hypothetical protein
MIFNLRMKKIITLCSFSFTVMLFLLFGGTQSSCSKNTTCQVSILVTDTANVPVAGASVKLYANITPPGQVQATGTTDNTGHVQFTFQLPAIFDIQATKGTKVGTGLIQLQVGGTATQTVIIK